MEKIKWSQEKEELLRKIANLESEKSVGLTRVHYSVVS